MSNKHKSFRKVLKIEQNTINNTPVTLVYWCIVERQTKCSIYSKHIAVTAYCGVKKFETYSRALVYMYEAALNDTIELARGISLTVNG